MASKSLGVLTLDLIAKTGSFEQGMGKAQRSSEKWRKQVESDLKSASSTSNAAFESITNGAVKMAGAVGLALSVRQIIEYADTWSDLNARIASVVGPGDAADSALRAIATTARSTYSSLDQTAEAFLSNATALTELGYSTEQQLLLSDALNNAMVISGTKGQQAETAMNALSKAFAVGALKGQNWTTVLQSGGHIVQALADGLGVTTIELRKMASDGLLTTEKVVGALTSQVEKLRTVAGEMPATFSDGAGLIANSLLMLVGTMDQTVGASSGVAEGLVSIADAVSPLNKDGTLKEWTENFDLLADAAALAAIAIGSRLASAAIVGAIGIVQQAKSVVALTDATAQQAAASLAALQMDKAAALGKLEQAQLNVALAVTEKELTAALAARSSAAAAAAAVTMQVNKASAISVVANANAMQHATVAATGLAVASRAASAAMTLAGGPVGAIILAASALTYFATRASDAEREADELDARINKLDRSFSKMNAAQAASAIQDYEKKLEGAKDEMLLAERVAEGLEKKLSLLGGVEIPEKWEKDLVTARGAIANASDKVGEINGNLKELRNIVAKGTVAGLAADTDTASESFTKLNDKIRERILLVGIKNEADQLAARIGAGYVEGLLDGEGDLLVAAQRDLDAKEAGFKASERAAEQSKRASDEAAKASKDKLQRIADEVTALERAAHAWGMTADEVKIHDLTTQGATDTQLKYAESLLSTVSALEKQASVNLDAVSIVDSLQGEEEQIEASYAKRRGIILAAEFATEEERSSVLQDLRAEHDAKMLTVNATYWEKWLDGAERSMLDFDEISGRTLETFTQGFGSAFEAVIFDFESLEDAASTLFEGMARGVVNAIGQMIAQELALMAVQKMKGALAVTNAAVEVAAIGTTTAASLAATTVTTTAQVTAGGTVAAAWMPAALVASIGSFGAAAVVGLGALLAVMAITKGFKSGGYTGGGGVNDIAGVVHGQEFVFDAESTSRIGVGKLEAMRSGKETSAGESPRLSSALQEVSGPKQSSSNNVSVSVYEDASKAGKVERDESGSVRVYVSNIMQEGELYDAISSKFGLSGVGS